MKDTIFLVDKISYELTENEQKELELKFQELELKFQGARGRILSKNKIAFLDKMCDNLGDD